MFVEKMCVFVSRPLETVTHIPENMEIVKDFRESNAWVVVVVVVVNIVGLFVRSFVCLFARVGNDAKRVQVRGAQWMMRTVFTCSDSSSRRLCMR